MQLHMQVTFSKSRSETITMPVICSVIQLDLLPVFSQVVKTMLCSNAKYTINLHTGQKISLIEEKDPNLHNKAQLLVGR